MFLLMGLSVQVNTIKQGFGYKFHKKIYSSLKTCTLSSINQYKYILTNCSIEITVSILY